VVREISKEFIDFSLKVLFNIYNESNNNSLESHLHLLKEENRKYDVKIDEADNNKEIKKVFQEILSDRTFINNVREITPLFGEYTLKEIREIRPLGISRNFDEKLKNRQEEIAKKIEPIIRDYQSEVEGKNIIDIIDLTNKKATSLSVKFMKEIMLLYNEVTNTHLKYIQEKDQKEIVGSNDELLLIS
jgi:hypothetical protein